MWRTCSSVGGTTLLVNHRNPAFGLSAAIRMINYSSKTAWAYLKAWDNKFFPLIFDLT
jgi:hypothetical protein